LGDSFGAIADYTAVVELEGAPAQKVAWALVNRGVTKGELGDCEGAITDYTAVVNLMGARPEEVAKALAFRGSVYYGAGKNRKALRDFNLSLRTSCLPEDLRTSIIFYRGLTLAQLGRIEEALADCAQCAQSGSSPFVHKALQLTVLLHLTERRVEEALGWIRRFHELDPREASLDTRLQARVDMILAAVEDALIDDASRLVDALLETDPEELRARLQFLKPGLELARTHDESVLASLPEDERKIAREIARSFEESARPPVGQPPSETGIQR
jgi:tetratricopeptide (TPR) repeat protein